MTLKDNPYQYSSFVSASSKEALLALKNALNLKDRFGEYCNPTIVRSVDYPMFHGKKGWLMVMHSGYKLGKSYKKAWTRYQHMAHWFLNGYQRAKIS